jgi:AcrR family transcriptional regulator
MRDQGADPNRPSEAGARERARQQERAALGEAVLELSGERGFRRLTVEAVSERAGFPAERFHAHYPGVEECFRAAHAEQAEALLEALRTACAKPEGWAEGLLAALVTLFDFATERRLAARAVLTQVYVAGGEAERHHQDALERLSRAIDRARRETDPSRHSPPPSTAAFMIGAVEESVRWRVEQRRPELLWEALPELMEMIVAAYFGEAAGRRQLSGPRQPADEEA